jgi:excisionase family DNA binding protein
MVKLMSTNELPDILTVQDLMSYLNIGRVKAYELVNQENFPTIRMGKCIRISKDKLLKWIDKQ